MAIGIDKILNNIQIQIKELAPTLELFIDESVQPSVQDCEKLQKQLVKIQEDLAVYKYHKQEKELSPSFNIHAKVSEASVEKKEDVKIESKISEKEKAEVIDPIVFMKPKEETENKNTQPLIIGINDKFRFINELFKQNASEYNIAIEQLGAVRSWSEADVYLGSLKTLYGWKDDAEVVKYFYSIVKKRFS